MTPEFLTQELTVTLEYFNRSSKCLTEEDEGFAPKEGMMTVAQQVAHVANTVDWFLEGAFRPEGFNTNFEEVEKPVLAVGGLAEARDWLERSFQVAIKLIGSKDMKELSEVLPPGIMGGAPRFALVMALIDHTAHHRGVLTAYSRELGKVPAMPYMDV